MLDVNGNADPVPGPFRVVIQGWEAGASWGEDGVINMRGGMLELPGEKWG